MISAINARKIKDDWNSIPTAQQMEIMDIITTDILQRIIEAATRGNSTITVSILKNPAEWIIDDLIGLGYEIKVNEWEIIKDHKTFTIIWTEEGHYDLG